MKLAFDTKAWEHYQHWQNTDKAILKRLNRLLEDTLRSPYSGLGKPEPLKADFEGCWSRRITEEHRLVYTVENDTVFVLQCRFHYEA